MSKIKSKWINIINFFLIEKKIYKNKKKNIKGLDLTLGP